MYITVGAKSLADRAFSDWGFGMGRLARALIAAALVCVTFAPAEAEVRVALVIGNGAYQNVPRLPNPTNDANDVAAALKRDGFDTILATDLDKDQMDEATIKFAKASRTADVAMFYYSGHALQFAGVNYLAPVDAKLTDEADLRRMVRVDEIVSDLQQAKNLRILVLDSCRNDPLADELKRSIGKTRALPLQRGLAKMDAPQGMIVAYSTQAGTEADDGAGRNSPYTASFLKEIEDKEEIGTIFRRISKDVYEATNHRQLPELSLSLIGEFYLRGKLEVNIGPDQSHQAPDTAKDDFAATQSIDTPGAWAAFLKKHPDGFYASLAKERQAKLSAGNAPAQIRPSVPESSPSGEVRQKYREWFPSLKELRTGAPRTVAISPDGSAIVADGPDNKVKVWSLGDGRLIQSLAHPSSVNTLAISKDGRTIVTGSSDGSVRAWDMMTGRLLQTLVGSDSSSATSGIWGLAITNDGKRVISCGLGGIRVSEIDAGALPRNIPAYCSGMVVSPNDRDVFSIDNFATQVNVEVHDLASGNWHRGFFPEHQHAEQINALAISPDGRTLVTASNDRTLKVWDLRKRKLLRTLWGHSDWVVSVAISPDGKEVASGSDDGTLIIWDMATGDTLHTMRMPAGRPKALAYFSTGRFIVAGTMDNTFQIWDTRSGQRTKTIIGFDSPARSVIVRQDGSLWTNSAGLSKLKLLRGNESREISDDYKSTFLRETPFDPQPVANAK